jgi:DNA ligase-1
MFQLAKTLYALTTYLFPLALSCTLAQQTSKSLPNEFQAKAIAKPTSYLNKVQKKPRLQLARNFQKGVKIKHYWVSEKLDGVRGYWNGQQLLTRNGNALSPPQWFIENWPNTAMDGELWSARGEFEQISACIRSTTSNGQCWRKLKLIIFDLPDQTVNFTDRITLMGKIVAATHSPYLEMIKQQKLGSTKSLYRLLNKIVNNNGEGLMLHLASAHYKNGRSKNLLKLKIHQDAEARVIAHLPGKGKYKGLLGAIKVQTSDGIVFKIGSGFSDKERQRPPNIGSLITYKYIGKTQRGVPRFASFLRIKKQH